MSATFESIYDQYGTRIHQYLLGQLRRVDVAEDLFQTVMLRVVRKRRKLSNPCAWLFTVARNELRRHWAKIPSQVNLPQTR